MTPPPPSSTETHAYPTISVLIKAGKAQFKDTMRNQPASSETVVNLLHVMPPVIGGDSHIHLKWKDGNTHTFIPDTYDSFPCNLY